MSGLFVMEAPGTYRVATPQEVRAAALRSLKFPRREALLSPGATKDYLRLKLGALPHEIFAAILLNAQNRILGYHEVFRGTLNAAAVYPREIVKLAIQENAAAVVLVHNHPSGVSAPSAADRRLTDAIRDALRLVDCQVLDHIIVAGDECFSFAEQGFI